MFLLEIITITKVTATSGLTRSDWFSIADLILKLLAGITAVILFLTRNHKQNKYIQERANLKNDEVTMLSFEKLNPDEYLLTEEEPNISSVYLYDLNKFIIGSNLETYIGMFEFYKFNNPILNSNLEGLKDHFKTIHQLFKSLTTAYDQAKRLKGFRDDVLDYKITSHIDFTKESIRDFYCKVMQTRNLIIDTGTRYIKVEKERLDSFHYKA